MSLHEKDRTLFLRRYTKILNDKNPELWGFLSTLLTDAREHATIEQFRELGKDLVLFGECWLEEAKARKEYLEKEQKRSQYRRDLAKSIQQSPDLSDGFKERHLEAEMNLL